MRESAIKIQSLVEELENEKPNSTKEQKIAYINRKIPKTFKERFLKGIKAGGEVAVEEFVKNKYVKIILAILRGWSDIS